jgi:hypothetical protein
MSSPPTGKVNGLLAKGSIKSSDLQGPLTGHPLSDLVYLISGHGTYVNIHTPQHQNGEIHGNKLEDRIIFAYTNVIYEN